MARTVLITEAKRNFSRLLRNVLQGKTYIVIAHGRPVAKIAPVTTGGSITEKARVSLLKRLRSEPVITVGLWRRNELYEEQASK